MTIRIEFNFRHGLAEPTITRDADGRVLTLVHGQDSVSITLSEHSLRALGLALAVSVGSEGS